MKGFFVIRVLKELQIFINNTVALGNQLRSWPARIFARLQGFDMHFNVGQRDIEIIVPGSVMVEPAGSGRDVEPWVTGFLKGGQPLFTII